MKGMDVLQEQQETLVAVKTQENLISRLMGSVTGCVDSLVPLSSSVEHLKVLCMNEEVV